MIVELAELTYEECKPVLLSKDIESSVERWDDPGVYPSGAGGGPVSSYNYLDISGSYTVQFTDEQVSSFAYEAGVIPTYHVMTADEAFAKIGSNIDWNETITDFFSSREILRYGCITKTSVQYQGQGKFVVKILETEE